MKSKMYRGLTHAVRDESSDDHSLDTSSKHNATCYGRIDGILTCHAGSMCRAMTAQQLPTHTMQWSMR